MRIKGFIYIFLVVLFINGCGSKGGPSDSLLSYSSDISTEEINSALEKVFPIEKKSTFGKVNLKKALLMPGKESDKVALSVSFSLSSFEIPEGIDGSMRLSAGLRYDSQTKKIFLKDITPNGVQFSNATLAEYVSKGARSALGVIAMKELSDVEVYQMKESFTARFIKRISVKEGKIYVLYGL